jgi:hypothetical protein
MARRSIFRIEMETKLRTRSYPRGRTFLAALLFTASPLVAFPTPSTVKSFLQVPQTQIPQSLELYFCRQENRVVDKRCRSGFRRDGEVWKSRVSESGVIAWWVFPGSDYAGSGGRNYYLLRRKGAEWVSLLNLCSADSEDDCNSWQTYRPRSDVLPIVRQGYYDLRLEVDRCVKWNGRAYVDYDPEDYRALLPQWFDATNFNEAEIFWAIRYSGSGDISFEMQWFPIPHGEIARVDGGSSEQKGRTIRIPKIEGHLEGVPHLAGTVLNDPEYGIEWVGFVRGATWGLRGDQGFLLHPRRAYLGASHFRIEGDLLYVYDSIDDNEKPTEAMALYNRRTRQLELRTGGPDSAP